MALKIVLTNDDGYNAPGLQTLYEALVDAGYDVHIVAPETNQSAQGSSLGGLAALGAPVQVTEFSPGNYYVDGRPGVAVRAALDSIFDDDPPDLVISGTNRGDNTGESENISGTVNGAVAALDRGIPAIAVSAGADSTGSYTGSFANAASIIVELLERLQEAQAPGTPILPAGAGLSVNVPGGTVGGVAVSTIDQESSATYPISQKANGLYNSTFIPSTGSGNPLSEGAQFLAGNATISVIDGNWSATEAQRAMLQARLESVLKAKPHGNADFGWRHGFATHDWHRVQDHGHGMYRADHGFSTHDWRRVQDYGHQTHRADHGFSMHDRHWVQDHGHQAHGPGHHSGNNHMPDHGTVPPDTGLNVMLVDASGADSPGLQAVRDALLADGNDVTVVAPSTDQTGVGSALTLTDFAVTTYHAGYMVDATPSTTVATALDALLTGADRPDLVVSGADPGSSVGLQGVISATLAAAVISVFNYDIPAISLSVGTDDYGRIDSDDYQTAARFLVRVIDGLEATEPANGQLLPDGQGLSINVPHDASLNRYAFTLSDAATDSLLTLVPDQADADSLQFIYGPEVNTTNPHSEGTAYNDGKITITPMDGNFASQDLSLSQLMADLVGTRLGVAEPLADFLDGSGMMASGIAGSSAMFAPSQLSAVPMTDTTSWLPTA